MHIRRLIGITSDDLKRREKTIMHYGALHGLLHSSMCK